MNQYISINQPLEVSCSTSQDKNGQVILQYQIKNITNKIVYIFDGKMMPYLILQDDNSLLVLHGINPPDPGIDYYVTEIPVTRPVKPGSIINYQATLHPLYLTNHYEQKKSATELHGSIKVYCQVGWGETPITVAERHKKSINILMQWQNLTTAKILEVIFP